MNPDGETALGGPLAASAIEAAPRTIEAGRAGSMRFD
jgi:hypothetical protein